MTTLCGGSLWKSWTPQNKVFGMCAADQIHCRVDAAGSLLRRQMSLQSPASTPASTLR